MTLPKCEKFKTKDYIGVVAANAMQTSWRINGKGDASVVPQHCYIKAPKPHKYFDTFGVGVDAKDGTINTIIGTKRIYFSGQEWVGYCADNAKKIMLALLAKYKPDNYPNIKTVNELSATPDRVSKLEIYGANRSVEFACQFDKDARKNGIMMRIEYKDKNLARISGKNWQELSVAAEAKETESLGEGL